MEYGQLIADSRSADYYRADACNHIGPFAPLVRVCFSDKWQPYGCD
jgi:hypothetical protein